MPHYFLTAKDRREHICLAIRNWLNKQENTMQLTKEIKYDRQNIMFNETIERNIIYV